jgi:hypothetical protein
MKTMHAERAGLPRRARRRARAPCAGGGARSIGPISVIATIPVGPMSVGWSSSEIR